MNDSLPKKPRECYQCVDALFFYLHMKTFIKTHSTVKAKRPEIK